MLILINATLKDRVRDVAGSVEDFTHIGGIVPAGRRTTSWSLARCRCSAGSAVRASSAPRSWRCARREFILAARMLGASTPRIMFRHLLPNVANIIIVSLSLGLAGIAGSEIVLTWFGVGIQPPHPSFGAMIFEATSVRTINQYPYLLLLPGHHRRGAALLLQPAGRRPDRRVYAQRPT